MKKIFITTFLLFFSAFAFSSNASLEKDEIQLEQKLENILNESKLSLSEKTQVQNLAFKYLEKKKKDNPKSEVDSMFLNSKENIKKYSAFTSALGVKLIEIASETGVSVDKFVQDSFFGKIALFYIFYNQGGDFIFKIFGCILISISVIFIFKYITMHLSFNSIKPSSSNYYTYKAKRGFLGRLIFSSPTKEKKVLLNNDMYIDYDFVGMTGLFYVYIFNVFISVAAYKLIKFIIF